jgi:aminoglycoside phosphotransferase (APT) family kinase protein
VSTEATGLSEHLGAAYGIEVAHLSALDAGVYRVDRRDGPAWVARVFASERGDGAEGDAEILRALERAGFPAERCAGPVSMMDGRAVLVTEFVSGARAPGRARTYAILGALLGRLHARPATAVRAGGGWHHLCPQGGPGDEIAAVRVLLDECGLADDHPLRSTVEEMDDAADLPHAFVHPDFAPANAIVTGDDQLVIIDWAGSGRGPRLWSLGFLLWAAGAADLRLVDWALTINCWSMRRGYKKPAQVLSELARDRTRAEEFADRAIRALTTPPDR